MIYGDVYFCIMCTLYMIYNAYFVCVLNLHGAVRLHTCATGPSLHACIRCHAYTSPPVINTLVHLFPKQASA